MEDKILEQLILSGKVSKKDVQEIEDSIITPEKENIIDLFHTIHCKKDHDAEECLWYREELFRNIWKQPCHDKWMKLVTKKARLFDLSITDIGVLLHELMPIRARVLKNENIIGLILFLLSPDLSEL